MWLVSLQYVHLIFLGHVVITDLVFGGSRGHRQFLLEAAKQHELALQYSQFRLLGRLKVSYRYPFDLKVSVIITITTVTSIVIKVSSEPFI